MPRCKPFADDRPIVDPAGGDIDAGAARRYRLVVAFVEDARFMPHRDDYMPSSAGLETPGMIVARDPGADRPRDQPAHAMCRFLHMLGPASGRKATGGWNSALYRLNSGVPLGGRWA